MNFVKHVVTVEYRYVEMKFEFDKISDACEFMETFLDHVIKDDEYKFRVYMERVDIFGGESEE